MNESNVPLNMPSSGCGRELAHTAIQRRIDHLAVRITRLAKLRDLALQLHQQEEKELEEVIWDVFLHGGWNG